MEGEDLGREDLGGEEGEDEEGGEEQTQSAVIGERPVTLEWRELS